MNYFELFELPVSLIVDQNKLSLQYTALKQKYHPDHFANAGKEEQSEALEKSALADKGIEILKDPDNTIKYVLEIRELYAEEENYELSPDFLMEMAQLNKGLHDRDILNIEEAKTKAFQLEKNLYHDVQHIIDNYNDDTITEGQLLQVKDYYYRKKYLRRILDRMAD